ncbi:ECF RNA polymerase sigma factor SigK [Streptomyces sp. NBC_00249]|uniref:ECF RNA polymerase sigma factor SigK n=1 Tax=Streptomyces sp. NBC_00249 TaxID=2975690 RepID=UPI00225413E1|nr:ECF RNA polymerase sigma factor SigK [Streptomyces sp. NBC_00249]MCX5193047.1 ECF RNA polymerase sigma factor SigK [Streptomyces sp. NBC_00249]
MDDTTRAEEGLSVLLGRVAEGDEAAFVTVYEAVSGAVLGTACAVLRDRAQAEEVTQEVFVEVWRTAGRYRADRGGVRTWVLTMAHRRAVDRVRSAQAAADRERRSARLDAALPEFDEVSEEALARDERDRVRERVRRCLGSLTEIQRRSVALAYYRGLTCREVSEALSVPLGTVKTRLRDGMLRLRDCLGVSGR